MKIGIIGFGNFGRVLAKAFADHEVLISSRSEQGNATLEEVCQADWVFPCVPISAFPQVMRQIKDLLSPTATVIEVCSVQVFPVKAMLKELKPEQPMIASHPMFGPNSTEGGTKFAGLILMHHNLTADADTYESFVKFWQELGVETVEMTPEEHDRAAAYSLLYAQTVNRLTQTMDLKPTPIDTPGFKKLLDAADCVPQDTWELFADMNNYNPFAAEMRGKFKEAFAHLEDVVENGPKPDYL